MQASLERFLLMQWRDRVDGDHLYRGMGAHDLTDPLDPAHDPFGEIRDGLERLLVILQGLLDRGFQFTVYEDYSGLSFDLADIVTWTRADLRRPGIDFTSSHEDARGYARNFQGSQLKQNFRYITDHLPERRGDALLQACMTDDDWGLTREINDWVSRTCKQHRRIVIWVRRSCPVFETDGDDGFPLGTFDHFRARVLARLAVRGLSQTVESARSVLPAATGGFCHRLTRPLRRGDIERIENVPG